MVDNCFSVGVFCVCGAIIAILLKQYCHEQSLMVSLAASAAVLAGALLLLTPQLSDIMDIFASAGISDSFIALILKAAAICFITQITCELCRDSGEGALAAAAELWGRGALTVLSLPVVRSLLELIQRMIE